MINDERDLTPESGNEPDDELRYAPPAPVNEAPEAVEADEPDDEQPAAEISPDSNMSVTDDMDIEAALAAVSTLSDMLAEQEAAEQARIAQIEAEAQAAAERQARLEHPEQFFPVPPMLVLHRGQMASVIPALVLIGVGAWLTFTLTTAKTAPDPTLTFGVAIGGIALVLLARWLTSGRWTRGALFGGLALLLGGGALIYLLQPVSPGLIQGWPLLLVGVGLAAVLTGLIAIPRDTRLMLPGLALIVGGIAGLVVSLGVLGDDLLNTAASLWPAALVIILLVGALPLIFRRRG
jgi:hypothetical protein